MKKAIIAVLAFVVLATGVIFAVGQKAGDGHKDGKGKWAKRAGHRGGGMGFGFRGVELTDDQKAKFKELRQASGESIKPLRQSLKAVREKMQAATANGAFDEAAVTALANEQASISAKMIVERQRAKAQFFALLTDEQKAKAAEMKAKRGERKHARKVAKAEKVGE